MTRPPRRLLLVAPLAAFLAACSSGGAASPPPASPSAVTGSPNASIGAEIDRAFIDMMVPHHQSAVEMAKLAQERGQHAEVKRLAEAIIASQQSEIDRMRSWRKAWFGSDQTPPMNAMPILPGVEMPGMGGHGMGGSTMDMTADVEKLRKVPAADFDRAFIDAMVPHHQSAVSAARVVLEKSGQPDIRELANEIIVAQEREINELTEWRKAWFPNS
jgi:uncharacterized protein (DUF305 family)